MIHVYFQFGDRSCINFSDTVWIKQTNKWTNKRTDKQTSLNTWLLLAWEITRLDWAWLCMSYKSN